MNERIKKLAEQANQHAQTEYGKWEATPDYSGIPHFREIYTEKLVELVVQECSGFVYNYPEKYLTRDQAREMCLSIEQNFGVEE